jgi:CubicO group peptidase (beta-lactamase class C family)
MKNLIPTLMLAAVLAAGRLFAAEPNPDAGPAPTPEELQATEQLSKRGALVQPLAATLNWRYVNLRGVEKPDAAAFALLGKLATTVELDLSGTEFKPEDLAPIAGLKALTKLNLSRTPANDVALAHLKGLEKLEMLNLFHTNVTDAGLANLNGLKNLKRIYLFETKVTDAGADALAKALPTLRIDRGWDKQPPVQVAKAEPPKPDAPKPEPPKPAPPAPKPEEKKPEPPKPVAALTPAKPEEVGLDPAKLAAIRGAMTELIAQKRGAGVVTLVVKDGRVVHHEAAGMANIESGRVMSPDAMFWIASMTKNITATAVMILVDEGKLNLDEPAQKWVPELANVKLADGKPLARPVTLRDLLSHTSGIPDPARKPTDGNMTLAQYTVDILKEPFQFQPGEKFEYSFGTRIAGRCVEVAGGKPFIDFIQERILGPLNMTDTTFAPDAAQRLRIARTYKLAGDKLVPAHCAFLTSEPDVKREAEPSGGLFSTALDMARFYEMIRNGGELDGKRIVSAKGVAEMTKSHTVAGKPIQYGLGWFTNGGEKKTTAAFGTASFGHGGAFGTHGWIDPEKKMTVVFMVQNVLVAKGGELRDKFTELAAGAVK